jgi:hypothetical protein
LNRNILYILGVILLVAAILAVVFLPGNETSLSSDGREVPVAANESNIRMAKAMYALREQKLGTVYYYYVDGRPDDPTRLQDETNVVMTSVDEARAITDVQGSLLRGTYRIIALRNNGDGVQTCPYVKLGELIDAGFGG